MLNNFDCDIEKLIKQNNNTCYIEHYNKITITIILSNVNKTINQNQYVQNLLNNLNGCNFTKS